MAGNLKPASLEKPVKPHPLIESVRQPLESTGGNDMEGIESLRENAPATLLTLDRAVSLSDHSHLVSGHSSVWQARAFIKPTDLGWQEIIVVVVPAGGGKLGLPLKETLQDHLKAFALPGVEASVSDFNPVPLQLDVQIMVMTEEYNPDEVVEEVRTVLLEAFSLQRRKLGQALYLSELYQAVEAVTGVENSTCTIGEDPSLRVLRADDTQVIHFEEIPDLDITYREYEL